MLVKRVGQAWWSSIVIKRCDLASSLPTGTDPETTDLRLVYGVDRQDPLIQTERRPREGVELLE